MLLLIFTVLSLLEALRHFYVIEYLHRIPNKRLSFVGRFILGCIFLYLDESWPKYQLSATYTMVDWVIHDYVLNLFRGVKPVWLLNHSGPIDKFQWVHGGPQVWFIWKMLAVVGLVAMYYFN